MNKFTQALSNYGLTENGALTHKSSGSPLVDFFFQAAASRGNLDRVTTLFQNAFNEDKEKALKLAFWLRDIRGGAGERESFRAILGWLSQYEWDWLSKNLHLVPEYGRYDDLLTLVSCGDYRSKPTIEFLHRQFTLDLMAIDEGKLHNMSLLGKWLPSENASSPKTKALAKMLIASGLFGSAKEYRQALTSLRTALNVVEQKIAAKEYAHIDYSTLPSYAALKYRKAFYRNDEGRYKEFIEQVKSGEKVIKAGTLYPYDLTRTYKTNRYGNSEPLNETVEAQWKALPDYVPEINGLVVCDTSGSMEQLGSPRPIDVAISLALYVAQRNKSEAWKNYVVEFSSESNLLKVKGDNLRDQISSIYTGKCSNTNLQSVFDLILDRAKREGLTEDDMPKSLIIISDMEFDTVDQDWRTRSKLTNFEMIDDRYKAAGFKRPKMIWWNVASRNDNVPCKITDNDNMLISGCSPAILKIVLSGDYNSVQAMEEVINQKRYEIIKY